MVFSLLSFHRGQTSCFLPPRPCASRGPLAFQNTSRYTRTRLPIAIRWNIWKALKNPSERRLNNNVVRILHCGVRLRGGGNRIEHIAVVPPFTCFPISWRCMSHEARDYVRRGSPLLVVRRNRGFILTIFVRWDESQALDRCLNLNFVLPPVDRESLRGDELVSGSLRR